MIMEKVVILARVSTDKQEYQRQINELTDYYNKVGWEVVRVFANKVSGALKIEEREEIRELITYVKENEVKRVVCLEISRVGRNTLEALKIIQFLTDVVVGLRRRIDFQMVDIVFLFASGQTQDGNYRHSHNRNYS